MTEPRPSPDAPRLLMIRHTEVASRFRHCCYGRRDVGLSRAGRDHARNIPANLQGCGFDFTLTSPLRRARVLAGHIASLCGIPLRIDRRLQERDHGSWEGETWDAISEREGNAMLGMITAPDIYRPGSGETTNEVADRVLTCLAEIPAGQRVVVVAHAGPIAAWAGRMQGLPVPAWLDLIPAYGEGWALYDRQGDHAAMLRWPAQSSFGFQPIATTGR